MNVTNRPNTQPAGHKRKLTESNERERNRKRKRTDQQAEPSAGCFGLCCSRRKHSDVPIKEVPKLAKDAVQTSLRIDDLVKPIGANLMERHVQKSSGALESSRTNTQHLNRTALVSDQIGLPRGAFLCLLFPTLRLTAVRIRWVYNQKVTQLLG